MISLKVVLEVKGLGLWGAGKETFEADTTTFRTKLPARALSGRRCVVIPGAYVKGLIRGWAYRVALLLASKGLITTCTGGLNKCWIKETCGECIVCRVFGSLGGTPSPLEVTNFYAVKPDRVKEVAELGLEDALEREDLWEDAQVLVLTHVRIDDKSGKAAEGGLYEVEAVQPGATFYGEIRLYEELLGSLEGAPQVKVKEACRLILASLAQLNFSYAGRRSRVKVRVMGADLGAASEDALSKALLDGLRR